MTVEDEKLVEVVARAICVQRGVNPDCQNQGAARDGSVDGHWNFSTEHNFGRPYDNRWHYGWRNQAANARAAIAAYEAAKGGAAPAGWVMVPREPTPKMLEDAAFNLADEFGADFVKPLGSFAKAVYGEMLSAAPKPAPAAPPAPGQQRIREALIKVRDRFFPADQSERDDLWDEVNSALTAEAKESGPG